MLHRLRLQSVKAGAPVCSGRQCRIEHGVCVCVSCLRIKVCNQKASCCLDGWPDATKDMEMLSLRLS